MLDAGILVSDSFALIGENAATKRVRLISNQIVTDLKKGQDLTTAMQAHSAYLPDLFIRMVSLGEQTGQLPTVLLSLADHYEKNVRLTREFRSEIALPIIQFFAALIVVGCVIWFTGMIAEIRSPQGNKKDELSTDILGFGMQGTSGLILWTQGWLILFVVLIVGYQLMKLVLPLLMIFHRMLLSLPVIGPCLQAFAVARFSWGYYLTQNSGVPLREAINTSLSATGNPYFISKGPLLIENLSRGRSITESFKKTGLFDKTFLQMVSVGEASGTVPEALHRLSPQFEDIAHRKLSFLTKAAATAIWFIVAIFVVFLIFRMAAWYGTMIDQGIEGFQTM